MDESTRHSRKVAKTILVALLMLSGFALLVLHADFFLLLFAAVFFSVLLHHASEWLSRKSKISYGYALVIVLLLIAGFLTGMFLLIGPAVTQQVQDMLDTLPRSLNNLIEKIMHTALGRKLFDEMPEDPLDLLKDKRAFLSRVTGSFSTTVTIFTNLLIVIITGIFLAADPVRYKGGLLRLFPVPLRPRLRQVLDKIYDTLSLWMLAKLLSMLVVGVSTLVGLQILDIPLPYALALMAALFSFIPYLGPYLALAPALLIALMVGADKALYVLILYFSIQILESYIITPLIEKKIVALPPALTIMWMVLFGSLTGILGLILATPILAAMIVLVSELYVKDYLEKGRISKS